MRSEPGAGRGQLSIQGRGMESPTLWETLMKRHQHKPGAAVSPFLMVLLLPNSAFGDAPQSKPSAGLGDTGEGHSAVVQWFVAKILWGL